MQAPQHMTTVAETYEQSVAAIEDVLFKEDSSGKSRFAREIDKHVYTRLGKWLIGGGVVVIISMSGLYFQIQSNSEKINAALTKDQAALIIQRLDQLTSVVSEQNATIKELDRR